MPIHIRWVNDEKTIMMHQYLGSWTLTEILIHLDTVYDMIDSLEHEQIVDIIADVEAVGYPPSGMMTKGLRYYRTKRHPRQGIQVIVGNTFLLSFMRGLTAVASAVVPQAKQVRFVNTVDEAMSYIKSHHTAQTH